MNQYIDYKASDLITKELWWQKRNLQYTTSGYGSKIPTDKMLKINNRLHRIYCCIFSNCGTCYIVKGKEKLILREM